MMMVSRAERMELEEEQREMFRRKREAIKKEQEKKTKVHKTNHDDSS